MLGKVVIQMEKRILVKSATVEVFDRHVLPLLTHEQLQQLQQASTVFWDELQAPARPAKTI